MIQKTENINFTNSHIMNFIKNSGNVHHGYMSLRKHNMYHEGAKTKIASLTGSLIGTFIPLLIFAKKYNRNLKNPLEIINMSSKLPEMLSVSGGAIFGGVLGGMLVSDKKSRRQKKNEGVFQFMNAVVPPVIVYLVTKLCEKVKALDNKPAKVIGTIGGLLLGMHIGAKLSNLINDPYDKVPDRKLTMKDSIANIDDAIGALAIAKFTFVEKLHINKIIPFVYTWCGTRAGQSN